MSKSVIINGVAYTDVPYVNIPLSSGGGNAKFVDTDSGDAVAGDLRSGKKAWVDGAEVTGTSPAKSASDVAVSGKTVTVPAGIYDSPVSKSVADGAATPGATVTGSELGATVSDYPVVVTPKAAVGTPGYLSAIADGAAITKYIQVETKSATPSDSAQTITPTAGKLLKSVSVAKVTLSGDATAADVMAGKTFYGANLTKLTGSASVPAVSQDSMTKVLAIS